MAIPDELTNAVKCPPAAQHVWGWFLDIGQTRAAGGMGPSRISRLEIQAWEADEAVQLQVWERRAILLLDSAWLTSVQKSQPKGGSA